MLFLLLRFSASLFSVMKKTDDAVKALDIFGKDESAELRELAINLLNRNK